MFSSFHILLFITLLVGLKCLSIKYGHWVVLQVFGRHIVPRVVVHVIARIGPLSGSPRRFNCKVHEMLQCLVSGQVSGLRSGTMSGLVSGTGVFMSGHAFSGW